MTFLVINTSHGQVITLKQLEFKDHHPGRKYHQGLNLRSNKGAHDINLTSLLWKPKLLPFTIT